MLFKKILFSLFFLNFNIFAVSIEKMGDILNILIPTVAYGTTLYLNDKEGQTQFYKSFGTNMIITYGLKYSVNKKRPNGGRLSFPSGHTSASFQGASFINKRYGFKHSIPLYISSIFVGYSRIESNKHYLEDVLAGVIIGMASSFYFTDKYKIYLAGSGNNKEVGVEFKIKF